MTMIHKIQQQDGLIKSLQSKLSKLSTEAEQLRKELDTTNQKLDTVTSERDDLAAGFNDMLERTVWCGGKLYLGHAGQKAREIAKKVKENGNA